MVFPIKPYKASLKLTKHLLLNKINLEIRGDSNEKAFP